MLLLEANLDGLFNLLLLYWLTPLILLIVGSVLKKAKPKIGKILTSIAGIMLIIGLGTCGLFFL